MTIGKKALLGTCTMAPFDNHMPGGDAERLEVGLALVDDIQAKAQALGKPLDIVLLPEHFSTDGTNKEACAEEIDGRTITAVAQKCRQYGTYAGVPVLLRRPNGGFIHAVVILDRQGEVVGQYDKRHPVLLLDGTLEGGVVPGYTAPVFDLDFGRIGAQICLDQNYDAGWRRLGEQGVQLVLFPSACSAVPALRSHAFRFGYYVLSSTYRPPSMLIDPLGMDLIRTTTDRETFVYEVDLDYRIIPWNALRDFGKELGNKHGDRLAQRWHYEVDACILSSNDPSWPIEQVMQDEGLFTLREFVETNRIEQDKVREAPLDQA